VYNSSLRGIPDKPPGSSSTSFVLAGRLIAKKKQPARRAAKRIGFGLTGKALSG